jgi:hypothetical protein
VSALPEGVELELHVQTPVRSGAIVRIALTLTNTIDRALDVYLRGREATFDVIVEDAQGNVVWERLKDEVVQAVLQIRRLEPAETLKASTTWNQRDATGGRVAPGTYAARALLLTDGEPVESPRVTFKIRQR